MITILSLLVLIALLIYVSDQWAQIKLHNDHLHAENRRIMRLLNAKHK